MQMSPMLSEAKRLYDLGFAVMPLYPKSKRPKITGWTTGPRLTWEEILDEYSEGDNLGVRLGEASKIGNNFLACIDIDIHDATFKVKAQKALKQILNGHKCPTVLSGSGKDSRHLYCVTKTPFKMKTLIKEKGGEVCIYSTGRQMVLAPSIHDTTGKRYKWLRPVVSASDLPLVETIDALTGTDKPKSELAKDWEPSLVDISKLSDQAKDLLQLVSCEDRSVGLYQVALEMIRENYTDTDIASVLTNPEYLLSQTAYDHAKTESRARAAKWVLSYTIRRAREELDVTERFDSEVEITPLSEDDANTQALELCPKEFKWEDHLEKSKDGRIKPVLKNVLLILENALPTDTFKLDIFAQREIYGQDTPWGGKKDKNLTDVDTTAIKIWLLDTYGFEATDKEIQDVVVHLTNKNAFNPIKDLLEGLPEWDGVNRLDTWLKEGFEAEGPDEYLAQIFRKWLVAAVSRAYIPGIKFDWIPIFEGEQGIGKSSFGRMLAGDAHFLDWLPDLTNKESALMLQGAWFVEFGELASLRKWDLESTKAFITRTIDKFRPPYGRKQIESPRRCIFFGTTNSENYLRDETGNRRFKPVKVGNLNFKKLKEERTQLFAEALFIFKNDLETTFELEGSAYEYQKIIQSEKMIEDDSAVMLDQLLDFFDQVAAGNHPEFDPEKFKMAELFNSMSDFGKNWKHTRANEMFAGKALRKIGVKKREINGRKFWKKNR